MKFLISLTILLILGIPGYGQSKFNVRDSQKYYYFESFNKDSLSAKAEALEGICQIISATFEKSSRKLVKTDYILIKRVSLIHKQMVGLKYSVIAFADKKDIEQVLLKGQKADIPVVIGLENNYSVSSTETAKTMDKNHPKVLLPESIVQSVINEQDLPNVNPVIRPGDSEKSVNSILDDLVTVKQASDLFDKLEKLKNELRLNYGSKKNYPDDSNCYLFFIDVKTNEILAIFDKGTDQRKNFKSKQYETNIFKKFNNTACVYVNIN